MLPRGAFLFASSLWLFACGGQVNTSPDASTPAVDSGTSTTDGGVLREAGAGCIDVSPSSFDTSCKSAVDCTVITTGVLCPQSCQCGGTAINVDGLSRYQQLVAGLGGGACPCPAEQLPSCVSGHCTFCTGSPGDPPGCATEAGACVYVDPANYDESCQRDTDCTVSPVGNLCPGACDCAGEAVSLSAAKSIQQAIAGIAFGGCPCPPPLLQPRCVGSVCTSCLIGDDGGCGDGG